MSAGMNHTSRLSVGVYRTALCLQVYAIQRYVCGHVRRIVRAARAVVMRQYRTAQDCSRARACCTYEPLACMRATSYRIAGMWVYIIQSYVCRRTPYSACLQVYAIQRSVCGHAPYIALVCRCIPYRTELCLQAYTVQCLSAGVCHTALCLRACTIHRACLLVYTISYRAMSASVHRTVLVCRCMPYSAMSAGMYRTSCLSVGVYHIIRSYVCRRIPCHT